MADIEPVSVLIVDDSPDKIVALEAILRSVNVEIVTARSGRDALRRLLAQDFAVILLDVRMPGMDGFETAALIRQRARSEHTPIIFVTAFPDETHIARGYSLRAVDYILTPVMPDVLRTKVSVFVDLYRTTAQVRQQAESLRHRASQLHRMTAASVAINSAGTVERMLEIITTTARDILGAERAVAAAALEGGRTHRAAAPAAPAMQDQELEQALASVVCRSNRACRTTSGILGAPFVGHDGRNMGLVEVVRAPENDFTQEDEDLLVQLAQIGSIAIENTLFAEEHEANRLKDEFLATVSHELRTPLTAMLSWAYMLRRADSSPETTARAVDAIERNVKTQARIIDDLLDVSRIVNGKLRLSSRLLDLTPVIGSAVDAVLPAAESKHITVAWSSEPVGATVLGDGDRLQQVFWNLLSNAIKFTPRGGRVDVQLSRTASDVAVRVTDTGQGIAPTFLPHVFERFRQADASTTRHAGGLGLGLAIVRHLVELHGGWVEADSQGEGSGATFLVTLPLVSAGERIAPPVETGAVAATAEASLHGLRVLVVEDEPDTRDAISLLVTKAGARVVTVGTAREALAAFEADRPDVLVCDIGLPGEDGYSLLGKVRAAANGEGSVPAVALTAYAQERDRVRAEDAGFQSHVAKPVDPGELIRVLARVAGSKDPSRAPERPPVVGRGV